MFMSNIGVTDPSLFGKCALLESLRLLFDQSCFSGLTDIKRIHLIFHLYYA